MHDWLLQTRVTVANGGGTAKAIACSLTRRPASADYFELPPVLAVNLD